jgi:hypothetical protein
MDLNVLLYLLLANCYLLNIEINYGNNQSIHLIVLLASSTTKFVLEKGKLNGEEDNHGIV